jgi:DNA-directed RNA polymerase subunit RPC12/RpoP
MEKYIEADKLYRKKLRSFERFRTQGIDLAYRCERCSSIVVQSDILFGVGCRKCQSSRVYPITQDLTWFGTYYCALLNWFWNRYYVRKFKEV